MCTGGLSAVYAVACYSTPHGRLPLENNNLNLIFFFKYRQEVVNMQQIFCKQIEDMQVKIKSPVV